MFPIFLIAALGLTPPQVPDLHHHRTKVHQGDAFDEGCRDIQFSAVSIDDLKHEGHWSYSPSRRFAAFESEHEDPQSKDPRLVMAFYNVKTKSFTSIRSSLFSHRWFGAPKWSNDHLLQFDIWTGPSYGVHYLVDVKQMKVIWAKHFNGEQ